MGWLDPVSNRLKSFFNKESSQKSENNDLMPSATGWTMGKLYSNNYGGPGAPGEKVRPMDEVGVSGVWISSGYVQEEFLRELQGDRGRRTYREMADNDSMIGAILAAIELMLRSAKWTMEPNEDNPDQEMADLAYGMINDMEDPWEDFISEALTFLPFGFSFFEVVYKRRVGPFQTDPSKNSKYTDGLIGLRKIAPRAQESLQRWEVAPNGDILGFWQQPPEGGQTIYIPMEKGLLFRTTSRKNNPEGRSVLRNAFTSYYFKKNIQITEAIGIERELNGVPMIRVPSKVLTDPNFAATKAAYEKMARDLKFNEQGGILVPSDVFKDDLGKLSNIYKVSVELLSSSGSRNIDTDRVITRYDQSMARTVLADFLMLGTDKGSVALSKSKTDLFLRASQNFVNIIAATFNRKQMPRLWKMNGLPIETMPYLKAGDIAPVDLEEIGNYLNRISMVGVPIGGDPETEEVLREWAGLPLNVGGMDNGGDLLAVDNPKPPENDINREDPKTIPGEGKKDDGRDSKTGTTNNRTGRNR